ncbi:FUSC family protein [Lysinibacter cavernae]|uniref:Integral membrane bound transporter domain-containing protein n=1 Tax=Lysinibacter cavernae TaxID=1640652 RepID=A0A7X5QZP9_9MICO|nr:FUSC family protein [Lysinibacter cavernae]NIH52968.1 hypothetical protein [Lysinibacter cavernae]
MPLGIGAERIPHPESSSRSTGRAQAVLGLKILGALLVIGAPIYGVSWFVPGLLSVAFFGVLAAGFGWISGGPRLGAAVVFALSLTGTVSILLREHVWALALILVVLGVAYGYASSRGVGKAVLQLPILTPYFMMSPPVLFANPPVFDIRYFIGLILVMNVTGLWAVLVLHLATGTRRMRVVTVSNPNVPLLFGALLGVLSAGVMLVGTATDLTTHWVWVTLTLYVIADPTELIPPKRMLGRLVGTFAGFAVVAILALAAVPDAVLGLLALPAVWCCMFFMVIKKPYWQYSFFLTLSVVLMNSGGVSTLLLDAERFGFTVAGAGLAMLAAMLVNVLIYRRFSITPHRAKFAEESG